MAMKVAEALELVGRRLQAAAGEQPVPRDEIVRHVVAECGCDPSSVIPSDHCYNRINAGVRSSHVPLFLHVGDERSGLYRFVGRNFNYSGPVEAFPQGT